jgi:myosin-1
VTSASLQHDLTDILTSSLDYAKKKEKRAQIKVIKDETVQKDDLYKSHAIHVSSGEPPNSVSRPAAKRKPGVVRPITQGKLLKAGGPSVCANFVAFHPSTHALSRRSLLVSPSQSQRLAHCLGSPLLHPLQHP